MAFRVADRTAAIVEFELTGWVPKAEWEIAFAVVDEFLARRQPFAVIADCRGLRVLSSADIERHVSWHAQRREAIARWYCGLACVTASPMLRGTIFALRNTGAAPMPTEVFGEVDSGRAWVDDQLARIQPRAAAIDFDTDATCAPTI